MDHWIDQVALAGFSHPQRGVNWFIYPFPSNVISLGWGEIDSKPGRILTNMILTLSSE